MMLRKVSTTGFAAECRLAHAPFLLAVLPLCHPGSSEVSVRTLMLFWKPGKQEATPPLGHQFLCDADSLYQCEQRRVP